MSAPSVVAGPELIKGLQERAARALPAEFAEAADGWWLRHSPRCAWWAGTVLPHGEVPAGELARRVARAERFYAGHGAIARFQITPRVCPDGLDALLAEHGYRLSPGTLYPMLQAMENKGYLESREDTGGRGGRRRRIYTATQLGREALDIARVRLRELTGEVRKSR